MLALAFVDGSHGVSKILGDSYEYLRTARRTTDLPRDAAGVRQPDPLRGRAPQLAGAHRRPPARAR